jgi:ABC-type Fe3+ transport system substrate-binding protein
MKLKGFTVILTILLISLRVSAEELVILSPHWEGLRRELGAGFSASIGREVNFRYIDVGGTSDILRYINSRNREAPGVDLLFGGGSAIFIELASKGWFSPIVAPSFKNSNQIALLEDPAKLWRSTMLTAFGILCNVKMNEILKIPVPESWRDLSGTLYKNELAMADPRKSGAAHMHLEILLQGYGYNKGGEILRKLFSNARIITGASSEVPWQVANGEVLCGPVIDSYASFAIDFSNPNSLKFILPSGETLINGDAVAIFANAPNTELAQAFITYVLSKEGQKILMQKVGTPNGPRKFELRKLSILPQLYETLGDLLSVTVNPFQLKTLQPLDENLVRKRWSVLNDIAGVFLIEGGGRMPLPPESEIAPLYEIQDWVNHPKREEKLLIWREAISR